MPPMTPEAVALTLEALARATRNRHLTGPQAADLLDHEAALIRKNEREERQHRRDCPECRLPETPEMLATG